MSPTATNASGVYPEDTPGLVCLPPLSDDLQLIWTQAELTSELDDNPQLIHTFSYFPYPTMPEIALLCLRYGLQMEKVKAWFMVQRIRCGISWSSEEIEETRSRLLYNQDQLHFKPLMAAAKKSNVFRNLEKPPVPSPKRDAEQVTLPHSPCLSSGDVAPEAKKLRLNDISPEGHGKNTTELNNEQKKKSPRHDPIGIYMHYKTSTDQSPEPKQILRNQVKYPAETYVFVPVETEKNSSVSSPATDEEACKILSSSWNMDDSKEMQAHGSNETGGGTLREDYYTRVMRRQRKTKEQLAILKSFFLQCQWARREDYRQLEEITGLPRADIIQWFGDTRYALKHGQLRWFRDSTQERPKWLDEPQHHVNQNGRHGEHTSGEHARVVTLAPDLGTPESGSRPAVKMLLKSSEHSMTSTPVVKLKEPSSPCSGKTMQKVPEIDADRFATTSGTPKSAHKLISTSTIVASSEPTYQDHNLPASQKKYDVLDRYWSTHHCIREEDLLSLVRKSGLSRKEILDWFCQKNKEPAEVEVCLDEEDDELTEQEDEVVIIQD
ncbi:homeobox and leucine zipper protein Homez-like isoform X1 [Bufo bufo]|uniref:homeobox and leucine zipper protein Homez-like isoform X1 n=1 Tax=Bufo bufo TaxID=8384 RepID=UPI001ABEE185|nr:homeobox and leucine zipper protein Homez-like isoform X1 [Bufo bufo]XP_040272837.1 homeobox and leucine zipper protein Homez-like isoform X1 [Bufo bufo]